MGTYYCWSNETKCEYIDPGEIGGGCLKFHHSTTGEVAQIVIRAMSTGWLGDQVELVADCRDIYGKILWEDSDGNKYKNVTLKYIQDYNKVRHDDDEEILSHEEWLKRRNPI